MDISSEQQSQKEIIQDTSSKDFHEESDKQVEKESELMTQADEKRSWPKSHLKMMMKMQ